MGSLFQPKFGTYTGTGAAQSITLGFKPSFVLILNETDGDAVTMHIQGMSDATAVSIGAAAAAVASNGVTLAARGFSVGSDTSVSESGKTFRYIAF